MTARSALYRGRVRHGRVEPFEHAFKHRVYYMLIDIDELPRLDGKLRLFSAERFNLFAFKARDHGDRDGTPLRSWAERMMSAAGVDLEGGAITVLTYPRVLGYVFNPISVWYCHGPDDDLRGILYEVNNTFGHSHTYVVPTTTDGVLQHASAKQLHVSPFNDMNQTYQFTATRPGDRLTLSIAVSDPGSRFFRAGLTLTRLSLTDRNLMRLFVTHPLLTLKVIGGIHWQALRIWMKGGRYRPVPPPAAQGFTVLDPEGVTP